MGSEKCPWVIQAQPGQFIQIQLWDFADYSTKYDDETVFQVPKYCREYALIHEEPPVGAVKNIVACDGEPRVQQVYTSRGPEVQAKVMVAPGADPLDMPYFALHYSGKPTWKCSVVLLQ